MEFFQDPQALLTNDTGWADADDLNAMIHALAADRRRTPTQDGHAKTESGSAAPPALRDSEAGSRNERGMEHRRNGNLQDALLDFDAALRLNPGLAVVYNNRGATRHELGDVKGALADFQEALRLDPDYADAYGNRAAMRTELGDAAGAAADCQRALELAPGSASLHARRGALLHKQENWIAARSEYDRALRLDAGLHWVYLLRGNTHYHTGDWRALCADYQKGFALAARRCAGLLVRNLMAALKSDPAAALHAAEQHVRQEPDNPIGHAHRGLLLLLLRRDAEAEADFARCRTLFADAAPYLELIARHVQKQLPPK